MRHNLTRAIAVLVLAASTALGGYSLTRPTQAQAVIGATRFQACFNWGSDESWTVPGGNSYSTVGELTYPNVGVPACLDPSGFIWILAYNTVTHVHGMVQLPYQYGFSF